MAQPIMNLWMIASIRRNEQKGVLIVGIPSPLSPIPLPFSLPPYPLSTPATQANRFQTKTAQKPYPMGRHIPKGLPPPPFIISLRSLVSKVFAEGR